MTWGKQNTEAEAHEQLSYAFDSGINFMDTAEMYPVPPAAETKGLTDTYIGTWMKNRKREDIILATKVRSCRVHEVLAAVGVFSRLPALQHLKVALCTHRCKLHPPMGR